MITQRYSLSFCVGINWISFSLVPRQHLSLSVIHAKPSALSSSVCLTSSMLLTSFPLYFSLSVFFLSFFLLNIYLSSVSDFSFIHLPSLQFSHPFPGRGNTAGRLCLHSQRIWEPLRAGGSVRVPGVLHHLVPQQTGPETAVAGVPGHKQR